MNRLPKIIFQRKIVLWFIIGAIWIIFPSFSPKDVFAIAIASQDQAFSDPFYVWQTIQELGNNLSGTVSSFTFRISTSNTNLNQFDYTAQNTRIYDKDNNNSYIIGCIPSGADSADPLRGLTFTASGVPSGFEDVTIDFSCRNYNFIPGHRYLILITNANLPQFGGKTIRFAAASYSGISSDYFSGGGLRYANGNPWDYYHNSGSCNPVTYLWNDQTKNPISGCNIWNTAKDDLYFVLSNTSPPPPPPKLPVIFIPGIGGSEMKASQDIIWSKDDGHDGTYSHAYSGNEKIWVNQDEAAKLGDDDYFDVLRLKPDGQTSEADLSLTGNLTSFGYSDIDSFFTGMGYTKGTNYFIFPYDWRKDVRSTKDSLDALIESAKTASGQSKVNLVVHSMGGLVARYYISDAGKAAKVNKLIELGVPHLGSPWATKALMYGSRIGPSYLFGLIALNINEVKDIVQNLTSNFQLIPTTQYFSFYNNSDKDHLYPFRDDRDIDNNQITGALNYDQTKNLLSNLNYNMTVFNLAEQFHSSADSAYNQTNSVKVYEIVGSSQPTLGQIHETWWITWPINLIPKTDQIFINGDDTVPLYSASLKSGSLDISGATKIYYVEQKHSDLVSSNGTAMQTVKSILNDDNSLPVEVKDQKIALEGQQISVDDANLDLYDESNNHTGLNANGDPETNIADTFYDSLGKTKHIFIKKSAKKSTVKVTSSKTTKTKIKIRHYSQDSITKTILYNDVPVTASSTIQFTIDPSSSGTPTLSDGTQTISATTEITGDSALDQTSPTTSIQISGTKDASGVYSGPVTITLTGNDTGSGILRIEYSLDNGQTVQTYTGPFTISTPGKTTIQFKSIDNLGNEEIPQSIIIEIAVPPTPTSTPSPSSSSGTTTANTTEVSSTTITNTPGVVLNNTTNTSKVDSDSFEVEQVKTSLNNADVLGLSIKNPGHISDQINVSGLLDEQKKLTPSKIKANPIEQILGGLLIVSGGIVTLATFGLIATFMPWKIHFPGGKLRL